ncbi:MAG: type II toxin-antitoxin system VapC family toxin [Isosphaerales bacterium]
MPRYLFDTDHLTLFQHGHAPVARRMGSQQPGAVGISVVTIQETLRGRLAGLARASDGPTRIQHYVLLEQTIRLFAQFPVVPFDQAAETNFQRLRAVRIGTSDRKIASIALANQLILVTANRRDFARVPGLLLEDWSV